MWFLFSHFRLAHPCGLGAASHLVTSLCEFCGSGSFPGLSLPVCKWADAPGTSDDRRGPVCHGGMSVLSTSSALSTFGPLWARMLLPGRRPRCAAAGRLLLQVEGRGWRAGGHSWQPTRAAGAVSSCPTQMFRLPDGEEAGHMQTAVTINQARASWDRGQVGQRPWRGWCWQVRLAPGPDGGQGSGQRGQWVWHGRPRGCWVATPCA